jgi:site-specific recombinase XerD
MRLTILKSSNNLRDFPVLGRTRMTLQHRQSALPLHDAFLKAGQFLRNWSPSTLRTYEQGLRSLGIEQPSKIDLDQWVIRLRERGLTPGGVNMYVRSINSYLTWLHEEQHADARLRVKLLRVTLHQHTLLTDSEVKALLHFKPTSHRHRRAHVLVLLLLDTGVRITEALTLERSKVRLDDLLVTVMGKGRKERTVPFSLALRPFLFRWLRSTSERGPFVFATRTGSRLQSRNAFRDVRALVQASGVNAHVHPHLLRHQFAATYIRKGGDIYRLSRLLGHTAVTTTQLYLRSLGVDDFRAGLERLTPLAS